MKTAKLSLLVALMMSCFAGSMNAAMARLRMLDGACSFNNLVVTAWHDHNTFDHDLDKEKSSDVRGITDIIVKFKKASYVNDYGQSVELTKDQVGVLVIGTGGFSPEASAKFNQTGELTVPWNYDWTFVFFRR